MTPKGTPYELTRAGRIKSAGSLYDLVRWNLAMVSKKHHARVDYKKFLKGKIDE